MFYPARWKKITVDQSKVLENRLYRLFRFYWATRYIIITQCEHFPRPLPPLHPHPFLIFKVLEYHLRSVFHDIVKKKKKKKKSVKDRTGIIIPAPHSRRFRGYLCVFPVTRDTPYLGKTDGPFYGLFHIISTPFLENFSQLTPYLGNIMVTPVPFFFLFRFLQA